MGQTVPTYMVVHQTGIQPVGVVILSQLAAAMPMHHIGTAAAVTIIITWQFI
jgi:hypothetical protein